MENKKEFKLKSFDLHFERGWMHKEDPAEQVDRYEGSVSFFNEVGDIFTMKIDAELSFKILEVVNKKLAENTETLVNNIKSAIKNEDDKI